MKPILYDEFEKTFESNGIGILSDTMKCIVLEEQNGPFELLMTYPIFGIHGMDIAQRLIILAKPDPVRQSQPFRIYRITKPINGIVTIYARHIAYDLMGIAVNPFKASGVQLALQSLKNNAITSCPFSFFTDKSTTAELSVHVPKSIWSLLGGSEGSVLDVYRGEWEFDRYNVKLWNHRGTDRGVTIRYGKNLTSLEQDENCSNCYTGICPYWTNYEGKTVMLPERIVKTSGTYPYESILPIDFSQEWDKEPTEEQLRNRSQRYIKENDIGIPKVSLKVEFVQLDQMDEYKEMALLQRVLIGDTVSVFFEKLGVDAVSRVVKIEYDVLLDRYVHIYLGNVKSNIADTIVQQQQEIAKAPTMTDIEQAKIAATAWLTNGKGYKVERRDPNGNTVDTLYMDAPDINTAVNVLRVGQSGIGFSHSGVNGPYVSAWTIDGAFNADFITTGNLSANLIKSGVINADLIRSGTLNASLIKLLGKFEVYEGGKLGGRIGYLEGSTGESVTRGIGVSNAAGDCYAIVTDAGVRCEAGTVSFYVGKDGRVKFNGDVVVSGNMTINGTVHAFDFNKVPRS